MKALDATGAVITGVPCFTFPTLADVLQAKKISWKYYAPDSTKQGYLFSTLDSFASIRNSSLWTTNVASYSQFVTDAISGIFPRRELVDSRSWG